MLSWAYDVSSTSPDTLPCNATLPQPNLVYARRAYSIQIELETCGSESLDSIRNVGARTIYPTVMDYFARRRNNRYRLLQ